MDPKRAETQIAFFLYELDTKFPKLVAQLNSARSPEEAADYFVRKFERPANVDQEAVARARTAVAVAGWLKRSQPQGGTTTQPPEIVQRAEAAIAPYTEPLGRGVADVANLAEQGIARVIGGQEALEDAKARQAAQETEFQARGGEASSPLRSIGGIAAGAAVVAPVKMLQYASIAKRLLGRVAYTTGYMSGRAAAGRAAGSAAAKIAADEGAAGVPLALLVDRGNKSGKPLQTPRLPKPAVQEPTKPHPYLEPAEDVQASKDEESRLAEMSKRLARGMALITGGPTADNSRLVEKTLSTLPGWNEMSPEQQRRLRDKAYGAGRFAPLNRGELGPVP